MATTSDTTVPAGTAPVVARMMRAMFPHPKFPDGPYARAAEAFAAGAAEDVRLQAQVAQGLSDLDEIAGGSFADLDDGDAREAVGKIAGSAFFEAVRAKAVTTLYDDREVWEVLGYEGPSFDQGGYLDRGFDDLDWLPDPRIEEAS